MTKWNPTHTHNVLTVPAKPWQPIACEMNIESILITAKKIWPLPSRLPMCLISRNYMVLIDVLKVFTMIFISQKQIFHSTQLLGGFVCSSTSCVVIVIIFIRYLRAYSCADNYLCMCLWLSCILLRWKLVYIIFINVL